VRKKESKTESVRKMENSIKNRARKRTHTPVERVRRERERERRN
jgi:hypothetical protein